MPLSRYKNIRSEARDGSNLASDFDNMRKKYIKKDDDLDLIVSFPSGESEVLEVFKHLLISSSTKEKFKDNWKMRPDYTSMEFYNNTSYWYIILYVNKIMNIEEFKDLEEILIPNKFIINEMLRYKFSGSKQIELKENKIPKLELDFLEYLKKDLQDVKEIFKNYNYDKTKRMKQLEKYQQKTTIVEKTETISMNDVILNNKYIDLKYQPVNPYSIKLYIDGFMTPQRYGYDYILNEANDSNGKRRISWDRNDPNIENVGFGLSDILNIRNKIKVVYLFEKINPITANEAETT
jgi:hypothetical protein